MATAHLEACKSPLNVSNENKNKDVIENISRESNRIETALMSPDKIHHQGALETLKGDSVGGEATAEANQEKFANVINVKNGGNRGNNINNSDNGNKFSFRTPQQFLQRKMWNKHFKSRKYHQKSYQQINKADMENVQNIKNQVSHQRKQQQANKNIKKVYNRKMISQRAAQFSVRSKFFLPDKRPRKEIIIPPTKFLLGGNISDPLNLNSLQDEALNATPTPTPKQSPITTPPKVEVIIPPNIHDPLHLLDPVDTVEYEKQLVSPMKRKSKSKHRNRKKKPKRKKRLQNSSSSEVIPVPAVSASNTTTAAANSSQANASIATVNESKSFDANLAVGEDGAESIASGGDKLATCAVPEEEDADVMNQNNKSVGSLIVNTSTCGGSAVKEPQQDSAQKLHSTNSLAIRRSIDREKVTRDLRLDLGPILEHQQQCQQPHSAGGNGGGRKRKSSEGPNSNKNKFRRLDAMDKIVSPVVPQPGAWKRPPRLVPTGARKVSRHRSTSVSETDLISPTEELKPIESEGDTPDVEAAKPAEIPPAENHPPVFPKLPKFKPEEAKYQYGNYDRYAGYRNLNEFTDVRLQVFQRNPNLFRGKDVLDVGCNVGHITIAVGKNLAPKSILGLDIDSKLIIRARRNLSMYVRIPKNEPEEKNIKEVKKEEQATTSEPAKSENSNSEVEVKKEAKPPLFLKGTKIKGIHHHSKRRFSHKPKYELERTEFFPVSFPISYGGIPSTVSKKPDKEESSPSRPKSPDNPHFENEFPKNVFFKTANYVLSDETMLNNDTQQYDLILCLSVTKWIHLNFGDTGLKMAFKRMFNQLRPGGKLILEAQNWASYKKKKNLTETIYENYRSIEFFPNKFHEYLLSNEVGFSHSYTLGVPRHLSKGFCRPIQLYAKGDFTPNHIRWSDNYHPQTPYEAYRGIYASMPPPPYPIWSYDTPQDYHGSYSCLQTPMHQPTSQYYNPLETDSYLPSYDTEIVHGHYVFASPLYQTVWSPPASLRNSSTHTPVFGSVRDCDLEDGSATTKHVYPPNDESSSPRVSNGAFNSIREADSEDCSQESQRKHVYANCENSSSPRDDVVDESPEVSQSQEGAADTEENSADKGDNNGGTLRDHDDG